MHLPSSMISLWRKLTRPHPAISDADDQRRAYTLAVIIMILLLITPFALVTIINAADYPGTTLVIGAVGFLFGVFNYGLSRTPYYRIAGFLIFLTISIACLSVAIINNETDVLVFLAFGSLIAQLTLPFRTATLVVTVNLFATILLGLTVPSWTEDITEEVFFVIVMSIVIFVTGYTRTRDLDQIQEQADMLVEAEWQMVHLLLENEKVRILSDFIRNVSHDFRTPLSIIATKAYLISKSRSPDEQQRNMDSINQQINRLTNLIDGMLVMSRLDSDPEIMFEPVSLGAILKEIVSTLKEKASEKQVELQLNLPQTLPKLNAHAEWLQDGLTEVIENGIVYTPTGGKVTINVWNGPEQIVIEVCDTGVGIPEEDIDHIFERLYRGDKTRPSTGGVGLGLSVAKRVIELHQGEITVSSAVDKGSIFRICLPIAAEQPGQKEAPTN